MCRELNREPAWVGAIRLVLTEGTVTPDSVIEETNIPAGRRRTVEDILSTMHERGLLEQPGDAEGDGRYVVGPVLRETAPSPSAVDKLSDRAVHQWV